MGIKESIRNLYPHEVIIKVIDKESKKKKAEIRNWCTLNSIVDYDLTWYSDDTSDSEFVTLSLKLSCQEDHIIALLNFT